MNGHASAGYILNTRRKATVVCTCGREFTSIGGIAPGHTPDFTAGLALERHISAEARKAEQDYTERTHQ